MKKLILITSALVSILGNLYAQVNLDSGLVAYFPFNGNANDESGSANHGTIFGATLTMDRFGNDSSAYYFDGDDYIKAAADSLPTAERTTSLWFYADTLSTRPVLLGYGGSGPPGRSWWMNINHGGTPAYFLGIHYTPSNYLLYYYTQEPTGEWINFVATTDSNGSKIYINGLEMTSNSFFINNTYLTGKNLAIGVNVSGNGIAPATDINTGYFIGVIDDIRIYNRALSAIEIDSLYNYIPTSVDFPVNTIFKNFELYQNYPNPFNPTTTIEFELRHSEFVTLKIYNILGEEVATLVSERLTAGNYKHKWNTGELASAVYFYKLEAGSFQQTKKLLLLK